MGGLNEGVVAFDEALIVTVTRARGQADVCIKGRSMRKYRLHLCMLMLKRRG